MNTATILILGGLALVIAVIVVGQRRLDRSEARAKRKPGGERRLGDAALMGGVVAASDGGSSGGDGGGAC